MHGSLASLLGGQPEDQLKRPMQALLEAAGRAVGRPVESRTEVRVEGAGGRPDLGVAIGGLLCGHVELKQPGKGARPERFRDADREQWKRFGALPNLIYTDANEWALYRLGERVGGVVHLGADLAEEGGTGVSAEVIPALADLLRDFLLWEPRAPTSPRALGEMLAPLCRLLRDEVLAAVGDPSSTLSQVAKEWRQALFAEATDPQFADAYAQTLTYALLLARFEGAASIEIEAAADTLRKRHSLLAQTLRILADPQVRQEIGLGIELLERVIRAVDAAALQRKGQDPWLYFYEDFLAAYDPRLRKDRGAYYTPVEVIQAQARLISRLLIEKFGKKLSFADEGVVVLDPAAGTGAYPLAAFDLGLGLVRERYGPGAVAGRASRLAENLHAFELLVGPYAVAHLRMTQAILAHGGELPDDGVHVYLTDTLESPHAEPKGQQVLSFLYRPLAEEHARARQIKAKARVLVCFGNPPYDREQRDPEVTAGKRKGGWVRFGDEGRGGILEDFLAPARSAGQGKHLKNVYNDYVYFWRWALWKVFETTAGPGIVSFITASSYLRGPGFAGMRQRMRETFDELWILDLEGDRLGARKTENVFAIRTPVAIAVGVRYGKPRPRTAARVRYAKVTGTREEKLAQLAAIERFRDVSWRGALSGWQEPLLPRGETAYWSWPLLTDLFPWQQPGVKVGRSWPIATEPRVLERRWQALVQSPAGKRRDLFKDSPTGRKSDGPVGGLTPPPASPGRLCDLKGTASPPPVARFAFRSFDQQWILADGRLIDRSAPSLWHASGGRQVYLVSLLSEVLGKGMAAVCTTDVPDLHFFRGSFGGKNVIPLWRDAEATDPNLTGSLLEVLSRELGDRVLPEDLFAYCYGLLASPAYVERFWDELEIPGPRIPISRDRRRFRRTAELGRRLLWLHTYGERSVPKGRPPGEIPHGRARCVRPVPERPDAYPADFAYDARAQTLAVGDGRFAPVAAAVWEFGVSGLEVVKSWLGYRMREPAGRSSSPLDDIRPERWTAGMSEALLHLLWVLEATVASFPELERNLDAVVAGEVFLAEDLPRPAEPEREPPGPGEWEGEIREEEFAGYGQGELDLH